MRHKQKGMSFLGLVFMFAAIATVAVIGIKMFPLYANEAKLKRALVETAKRSDATGSPGALRIALQRWWDIDDITFITPAEVTLQGSAAKGRTISYDYYARADLFADISVIVHFKGDVPVTGASGGAD